MVELQALVLAVVLVLAVKKVVLTGMEVVLMGMEVVVAVAVLEMVLAEAAGLGVGLVMAL